MQSDPAHPPLDDNTGRPGASELAELVARCISGEAAAWQQLVDRFAGLVYAIARGHRLDEADCDDVAQTVFSILARRLPSIDDPHALPGWITTTARRECWRIARSRCDVGGSVIEPVYLSNDDVAEIEARGRILDALDRLDQRCRSLLQLLYANGAGTSYQAAAEILGIPTGSVGPTRLRCLAKLQKLLGL